MTQDDVMETSTAATVLISKPAGYLSKTTRVSIEIPRECPECGFGNFNVWGTKMNGMISIVVKCMRCGK
jgi:hypothetical protein